MGQHFGATPFLIAGACVVEADELNLRVGEALAELGTKLGVHVIYKGSFDKANRSRLKGARGPGLERGLQALATVRSETGLPILTDVHDAGQVLAPPRWPTCCRSRRSCAARRTCSSPPD